METGPSLKRSISFPLLFLYGLGTMVGGGFYALSGKVVGMAGLAAPLSFLLAGILAYLNVFTFSELATRFPVSAGEARYAQEGFRSKKFSALVGWGVILTGVVSAATLSVATVGFLQGIVNLHENLALLFLILAMGGICAWGVGESVKAVIAITIVEVGALLYILFSKGSNLAQLPELLQQTGILTDGLPWLGVLSGAFLSFYAFIGFEDMVNMAEEVKDVRKALPKAMVWAVIGATLLYVTVSTAMVATVSPAVLAEAPVPMAAIIADDGALLERIFVFISILTGINGALVQIVMASRVLYGLAREGKAPKAFSKVHPKTRTPLLATGLGTGIVLALALFFPLVGLAEATSFIILLVFAILNLALIRIKIRESSVPEGVKSYPTWLPYLALVACLGILGYKIFSL